MRVLRGLSGTQGYCAGEGAALYSTSAVAVGSTSSSGVDVSIVSSGGSDSAATNNRALPCAEGWGPRSTVFDGRASHDACVVHAAAPASHSAAEQIEYTEYPEDRSVQRLYHDPTSAALAARRPRRARTAAGRLRTGPSLSQSAAACATACPAGRPNRTAQCLPKATRRHQNHNMQTRHVDHRATRDNPP